MNPPRRFYGTSPPGRLQATMLKVLAAEMSDAGRLRRGKHYFTEGAVLDIEIEPSVAEVVVQGSRSSPYGVAITVEPGSGVPTRREIDSYCPCPDAERIDRGLCKHGVAALFAIANEVAIEPDVLDRWRSDVPGGASRPGADADLATEDESAFGDEDEHLAPVHQLFPSSGPTTKNDAETNRSSGTNSAGDESAGRFNRLLVAAHEPGTSPIPDLGEVVPIGHRSTGNALLDEILGDALDELHLDLD